MPDLVDLYPGYASRWIDTSAGEIFARVGDGGGPPLLLLHGHPQSNVMWHRVAPLLAPHFILVIVDLPGYGWSAAPPAQPDHAPYTKHATAIAMIQVMETLGFDRFRLAGHDRGARVGYRLALDHPGRLDQLAVLDIVTTSDMWRRMDARLAARAWHWLFLSLPEPFPETLIGHDPKFFFDYRAAAGAKAKEVSIFDPAALAHYHAAYEDPLRIHAMCEDYRAGRTTDLAHDEADRTAGKTIGSPVLALWGSSGLPANAGLDTLACWRDWAPDLRGLAIESGHYLAEENPAATAQALLEFFGADRLTAPMTEIDRQNAFSGTRDVAERLRFDAERLEAYLREQIAGFAAPVAVSQFKGGQSNPTYLIETPLRRYALRRKPPGKLLPSAHAVDREYRVTRALFRQGFPVAEPLVYCADEAVIGTAFFVTAYVEGRVFWEPQMPASTAAERARIYDAMNATLAQLHNFDPVKVGLGDYGRGENYVARQVERWSKQYRASETARIEHMERLIAWLPAHLPPSEPPRLVHGDYRLDNMIIAPDAPKISAVLDWELSTLGDPLADFSYHLMAWHMPHSQAGTGSLLGFDLAALGIPSLADYVDAYRARTGLDPRPYLPVYFAYNFFRLAAIMQGITGRVRDGTATSPYAAAKAELVRPLAAKGWEFARQAGP